MATCPRCWNYLGEGHRCHGRWRRRVLLGGSIALGSLLGALIHLAADEQHVPLVGTLAGGLTALVLFEVFQTFFAERDVQLRSLHWVDHQTGFHPFALRREAERHRRSWRVSVADDDKKGRPSPASLLEQLLEQDALEAELDQLCAMALEEVSRATGDHYRTMSEPVVMPGSVRTIDWTIIGPGGILAFNEEWPADVNAEAMAHRLSALIGRHAAVRP